MLPQQAVFHLPTGPIPSRIVYIRNMYANSFNTARLYLGVTGRHKIMQTETTLVEVPSIPGLVFLGHPVVKQIQGFFPAHLGDRDLALVQRRAHFLIDVIVVKVDVSRIPA